MFQAILVGPIDLRKHFFTLTTPAFKTERFAAHQTGADVTTFFYISEKTRCQTRFRDASSNEWLRFEGISYTLIVFIGEYFVFSIKKSEVATRLKMFKMTKKQIQF
jgi:hypothetical protein